MSLTFAARPPTPGARVTSWWGKAWQRAVQEASYDEADVRAGRALARNGRVGAIKVDGGAVVAVVNDRSDGVGHLVTLRLETFSTVEQDSFVSAVATGSRHLGDLLDGTLPHGLVEYAEELGVELLPLGSDIAAECDCDWWVSPCRHALGLLTQLGWLVDSQPLVLLALRGMSREELIRGVDRARPTRVAAADPDDLTLEAAVEAAQRAARLLAELDEAGEPGGVPTESSAPQ